MTKPAYTRTVEQDDHPSQPRRMGMLLSEAKWLILLAVTVYLGMILLTFFAKDPGYSHSIQVDHIANWGGKLGAWCADLMLYVFGKSAWWWFLSERRRWIANSKNVTFL